MPRRKAYVQPTGIGTARIGGAVDLVNVVALSVVLG